MTVAVLSPSSTARTLPAGRLARISFEMRFALMRDLLNS
jgi:hypothetical protein